MKATFPFLSVGTPSLFPLKGKKGKGGKEEAISRHTLLFLFCNTFRGKQEERYARGGNTLPKR